jgi:serine acetyltransferase
MVLRFPESLPVVHSTPASEPIGLWGLNRHTALAALVFRRKRSKLLRIVHDGIPPAPHLCGVPIIRPDEFEQNSLLLHSAAEVPPPSYRKTSQFTLDHGAPDRLSEEMRRLYVLDLYRVSRQLREWGFDEESTFVHNFIFYRFNCRIPATAEIGEGTTLAYGGIGVVIHKNARIGKNVKIGQNVTLGARSGGSGPPVIGDNVFIGVNSVCLGGPIGNDAVVGAGSVVLKPVEPGAVVAGNPARVIRPGKARDQ